MHAVFRIGCVLAALVLAACSGPPQYLSYRVTVVVRFDGQTVTGSSVQELRYEHSLLPVPLVPSEIMYAIRGAAPVVKLPNGGAIVALMGQRATALPIVAVPAHSCGLTPNLPSMEAMVADIRAKLDHCQVPPRGMYALLTMPDASRPANLEITLPEDLGKRFGTDVTLEGIWLDRADFESPGSIVSKLPWLQSYVAGEPLQMGVPVPSDGTTAIVLLRDFIVEAFK